MKVAQRDTFKNKSSQSLLSRSTVPGRKNITSPRCSERRILFKSPSVTSATSRKVIGNSTGIPRLVRQPTTNVRDSLRLSKALKLGNSRFTKMNSAFVNPPMDLLTVRKNMMDRMVCLLKDSRKNMTNGKSSDINLNVYKTPCVKWTPKQSALAKSYIKLSESKKKCHLLGMKAQSSSITPTSPFKAQEISLLKKNANSVHDFLNNNFESQVEKETNMEDISYETFNSVGDPQCISHVAEGNNSSADKKTVGALMKPELENETSSTASLVSSLMMKNSNSCVFDAILKCCQIYQSKLDVINNSSKCLDDSIQRTITAAVGGDMYSEFCKYQTKKRELYKRMEILEEELEKAVQFELNVSKKFDEYLMKKNDVCKKRASLQLEFEKALEDMLRKYEEEIVKCSNERHREELERIPLNPIESMAVSRKEVKSHRRKSKRLSTPSGKTVTEVDIVRRNTRSATRKRLQEAMYRDLQKSFNLCSPENDF